MTFAPYSATFIGRSRPKTRRNGWPVAALRCGTVVTVVEQRAKSATVVQNGDVTFGVRYIVQLADLAR